MYSLVMMAAMTAAPETPQEFLCHVNESRYGKGLWLKHCFYDCCLPARYGWVNCWNKGFGYYPGNARSFCGSCATASYGHFYNAPSCCGAGCGSAYGFGGCGPTACGKGYGNGGGACISVHGRNDWGIGTTPAYWTNVAGCLPCVTAPPYAHYTQKNPCCTYGHFAFDSGLIGHSAGVGYAGFGGYGNFGFYGSVPVQHPPTLADVPKYRPQDFMQYEGPAVPYTSGREYTAPGYYPAPPASPYNPNVLPEAPRAPAGAFPTPIERADPPLGPTPGVIPPTPGVFPEVPSTIPPTPPVPPLPNLPIPKIPSKAVSAPAAPATVVVGVPAGAKVFVEGVALKSTAAERSFRTPALTPGQEYSYTVKAVIVEDGQEFVETKQVVVVPGETTTVSFEKLLAKFGPTPTVTQTGAK